MGIPIIDSFWNKIAAQLTEISSVETLENILLIVNSLAKTVSKHLENMEQRTHRKTMELTDYQKVIL